MAENYPQSKGWARILARPVVWLLSKWWGGFIVTGTPPREGPFLVAANHVSLLDPILVQYACKPPVHFLTRRDLFDMGALGKVMRAFGAFPVTQNAPDRGALRGAIGRLDAGMNVGIFPEGGLGEAGGVRRVQPGVALILRKSRVPIVCCHLIGTDDVLPIGTFKPTRIGRPIRARWGEPHLFDEKATTEEIVAWIGEELERLHREHA